MSRTRPKKLPSPQARTQPQAPAQISEELVRTLLAAEANHEFAQERIAELELAAEDKGWNRIADTSGVLEFSRAGLSAIVRMARLMYLKNPYIKRAVELQKFYVWAQGVSVRAEDPQIDRVVQGFVRDKHNEREFFGQNARIERESDLLLDGNLFVGMQASPQTGAVRLKVLPFDEVTEILCHDGVPLLYKRVWCIKAYGSGGSVTNETQVSAYYPDINATEEAVYEAHFQVPSGQVRWGEPVLHVRTGGVGAMRWGVCEIYAALDWATAYKNFLEAWAKITQSYATFAWNLVTRGGKRAVSELKTKFASTIGASTGETNPQPVSGSMFITGDPNSRLEPIKTAGATTTAEDGRRLALMVAAATGWPDTFFGDAKVGNLATAQSLDRPTELRIKSRQMLWSGIYQQMCDYALECATKAPRGLLAGIATVEQNDFGDETIVYPEDVNPYINIEFPAIIEKDTAKMVQSIVAAATMNGQPNSGLLDSKTIARRLLVALGDERVDETLRKTYKDGSNEPPAPVYRPEQKGQGAEIGTTKPKGEV